MSKVLFWIQWGVLLLAGAVGALATQEIISGEAAKYLAAINAVLVFLAKYIESHQPPQRLSGKDRKKRDLKLPVAVLLVFSLGISACGSAYKTAWTTAHAVREAGTATDKAIGTYAIQKHKTCLEKYGSQTQGYAQCTEKAREALKYWRQIARPTVNSALIATVAGLTIAEENKKKGYKWTEALRPAACAIIKCLDLFSDLFGKKGKEIISNLNAAKIFVCD